MHPMKVDSNFEGSMKTLAQQRPDQWGTMHLQPPRKKN